MKRADRIKLMQQALEREQAMDPEEDVTETEIKLEIDEDPKPDDGGNPGPAEGATTEDPPTEDPPLEDESYQYKVVKKDDKYAVEDDEVEVKVDDIGNVKDHFDPMTYEVYEDKIPDKRLAYYLKETMKVFRDLRDRETLMSKVMEEIKSYDLSIKPESALKLIDISKVTLNKDGEVVGLDEEIKRIQEEDPAVFKRRRTTKSTDYGMNPSSKPAPTTKKKTEIVHFV